MTFEGDIQDQRHGRIRGRTAIPGGDSLGKFLKKYSTKSYSSGVAGNTFSHINTVPQQRQEKESPETDTAVYRKTSFANDVRDSIWRPNTNYVPNTLANNSDGLTFAAKARAAELHASRARVKAQSQASKEAMDVNEPTNSASYLVLKPKSCRGRSDKSAVLAEGQDEKARADAALVKSLPQSPSLRPHLPDPEQDSITRTTWDSGKSRQSHYHPLGQSSTLFLFPADHSSSYPSPQLSTPAVTRPRSDRNDCMSPELHDRDISEYIEMPRKGNEMPRKGGQKGVSPVTPATEGIASQQPTPQPSSSHGKKGDTSRIHPYSRESSNPSLLNPNQQPFQPRSTPQRSQRATMAGMTPSSQGGSAPRQSGYKSIMDDPFAEHSQRSSSNFFNANQTYNEQLSHHQQPAHGHRDMSSGSYQQSSQDVRLQYPHYSSSTGQATYPQQSPFVRRSSYTQRPPVGQQSSYTHETPYSQPSFAQHSMYPQQSPYYQHLIEDPSEHGRTAYARQVEHGEQSSAYQQRPSDQQMTMNPRIAVHMPPPAVRGTPAYDSRVASLHATANDQELRYFYSLDLNSQREYLDVAFGPNHSVSTLAHGMDPAMNVEEDMPPQPKAPQSANFNFTVPQPRDPAPYTGYRTDPSKAEMLIKGLQEVAESSGVQGSQSDTPRTVLYDPHAHREVKDTSSESTVTTVRPIPSSSEGVKQPNEPVPKQDTVEPTSQISQMDDPATTERLMNDFLGNGKPLGLQNMAAYGSGTTTTEQPPVTRHEQAEIMTPANPAINIIGGFGDESAQLPKAPRAFPPREVKWTKPHGGATDFTTRYDVYATEEIMATHAGEENSHAVGNYMMEAMVAEAAPKKGRRATDEILGWFKWSTANHDVDTAAKEIRGPITGRGNADIQGTMSQYQTPPTKTYPTPIGHERASGSKPSTKGPSSSTTTPKKDVMKNPSVQDAANLVAGLIANLRGYAIGNTIGDNFTRWGRPSEWAIDRSRGGDNSFFGGGFEAAPQRVARDPRYQQTMTHDGRSTYFEDPTVGKGKGRAW